MYPTPPVVASSTYVSKPAPVSLITTSKTSPGFIISVLEFGVNVAVVCCPGAGGPVGIPLPWRKAKLTGSIQEGLSPALSMLSAAHHCVVLQLICRMKGG